MLPGDEPLRDKITSDDLLISADKSTHAPFTYKFGSLVEKVKGEIPVVTQAAPGFMSGEDKARLDSLQTKEAIDKISQFARREHAGVIIQNVAPGTIRLFRNLRGPGRIIRAYAETETGSFKLIVSADGRRILSSTQVDDSGTGLIQIPEDNNIGAMSLVTASVTDTVGNPKNATINILIEFDWS